MQQSEEKRAEKLRSLLRRLENGESIQNRQLETWLSVDGYARYEQLRQEQRDLKEYLKDTPPELIKYREGLQRVKFNYSKANSWDISGAKSANTAFENCQSEAERLAEYLQEILQTNPSLYQWLSNHSLSEINTASPSSFPVLITSRTTTDPNPKLGMTIREVKILAIELELSELECPTNPDKTGNPFNFDFYSSDF
jgi:hypothetical protein